MMFDEREEEKQRLKLKMELYGSYTREIEYKERRFYEMEQEIRGNRDNYDNIAKRFGLNSNDPFKPPTEKLILEYHSLEEEMGRLYIKRRELGLDDLLEELEPQEKFILLKVYVDRKKYDEIAHYNDVNFSKTSCFRTVEKIFESWNPFHQ